HRAYPHSHPAANQLADHLGSRERLARTWRPLDREDCVVQVGCDARRKHNCCLLVARLECAASKTGRSAEKKLACSSVARAARHAVLDNVLPYPQESLRKYRRVDD